MNKIFAILILIVTQNAIGWDGHRMGKLTSIDVTGAQNFGFRISLEGNPTLCSLGSTQQASWAYINKSNDNYQAYIGLLTAAMFAGKSVDVYSNFVNGACEIGYISVQN
jgi:hypothetical protein